MKLRTYRSKSSATRKGNRVYQKQETDFFRNSNSPIGHIMFLQRTIGNKAVQRLLKEVGSQQSAVGGHVQAKLKIGQPNDIYEQEADRVAEQVMRMPENTGVSGQVSGVRKGDESVQTKSAFPSSCSSCKEEELIQPKHLPIKITPLVQRQAEDEELRKQPIEEEEEEKVVQAKELSNNPNKFASNLETQISSLRGGGKPLPKSTRAFFEPRFGQDFSQVRVHTEGKSAETAQSVNSKAFTTGNNIIFGARQYAPGTTEGKRLLAHELTHVVQQSRLPIPVNMMQVDPMSYGGDRVESKAEGAVARIDAGQDMFVSSVHHALGLQRQPAKAQTDDCTGWEQDPESFSIHVARYVAKMQIDPSLVVKPNPGGKLAMCKDSRHCDVLFSNGLTMRVAWEPSTRITLGRWDSRGATLRSIYTYSCPGGQLILKFKDFTRGSE